MKRSALRRWVSVFVVTLIGCGTNPTDPDPDPVPTTVDLSPATLTFSSVGETQQLTATVRDQDGATMSGVSVNWTTSATSVVHVLSSGLVTSVATGTATVTATAGTASGTVDVTVEQLAASIEVTPGASALAPGEQIRLDGVVSDAEGNGITGAAITWESSNALVASVDDTGLVTAVIAGTAIVTASSGSASTDVTISTLTAQLVTIRDLLVDPVIVAARDGLSNKASFDVAFSEVLRGMAEGDLGVVRDGLVAVETLADGTTDGNDVVLSGALALVAVFGLGLIGT